MIHSIWNDTPEHIQVRLMFKQDRSYWEKQSVNLSGDFYLNLGVRPFKCDLCEKAFTQRCSLESHQRKVHGFNHKFGYKIRRHKLYVCEDCGHTSADPSDHYEHIKIFHPYSPVLHRYYDRRQFKFDFQQNCSSSTNSRSERTSSSSSKCETDIV